MKRVYYKSKWSRSQLDKRTVQYVLTGPKDPAKGVGVFQVRRRGELVSIAIDQDDGNRSTYTVHDIRTSAIADSIEPHPDNSVADFRLLMPPYNGS